MNRQTVSGQHVPIETGREDAAAFMSVNAFLNAYLREHENWGEREDPATGGRSVVVDLPSGDRIIVPVLAKSATRYRFGAGGFLQPAWAVPRPVSVDEIFDYLINFKIASVFRRRCHNSYKAHRAAPPPLGTEAENWSFIEGEQALITGHPHHPNPRSRDEMTPAEARIYAPEQRGRFALYWFYVARGFVAGDGVHCAETLGAEAGIARRRGYVALPFHPWQAARLAQDAEFVALKHLGVVIPIGETGQDWQATASMRCVYRAGAAYMLKTSLNLRLTNSLRVLSMREIMRGVQMRHLFDGPLGQIIAQNAPSLHLLHERGWTGIRNQAGTPLPATFALYRDNPFSTGTDAVMMAALCEDIPGQLSPLGAMMARLAARDNTSAPETARHWFSRFLETAIAPLLYLRAHHGILIGAHQQNMMIGLAHGWPERVYIRDGQGVGQLAAFTPHLQNYLAGIGRDTENTVDITTGDGLLAYYVIVNNVLNVAATLVLDGYGRDADFTAILRAFLTHEKHKGGDTRFIDGLLEDPVLTAKGNFTTSRRNINETDGDGTRQAAHFLSIPNPLFTPQTAEAL